MQRDECISQSTIHPSPTLLTCPVQVTTSMVIQQLFIVFKALELCQFLMYVIWLVCTTKLQAHIHKVPLMGLLVYMGICEVVRLKTCFTLLRTRLLFKKVISFLISRSSYIHICIGQPLRTCSSLKRNQPITIGTYISHKCR